MVLYIDAMSVFASVTAVYAKTPADNSVLIHVLYLRELLNHKVLSAIAWTDTRDMIADGLTKGTVDRRAIDELMDGWIQVNHALKVFQPKQLLQGISSDD